MGCKKSHYNGAFGGINCVLSEGARLIPSEPAWSIQNASVSVRMVLVNKEDKAESPCALYQS